MPSGGVTLHWEGLFSTGLSCDLKSLAEDHCLEISAVKCVLNSYKGSANKGTQSYMIIEGPIYISIFNFFLYLNSLKTFF